MNPIDQASAELEEAIAEESRARKARADAETRLVALLPGRDHGSVTLRGDAYRASIRYDVHHDVDAAGLNDVAKAIPPELLRQAITLTPVVIPAGLRYLKCNEPDAYAKVVSVITTVRTPHVGVEHLVA